MTERSEAPFRVASSALVGLVTLLLVGLVVRVAQLQLWPGDKLSEFITPRKTKKVELPLRGDLTDRRGRVVATTKFGRRVLVDPTLLPAEGLDVLIPRLAQAAGIDGVSLGNRLHGAIEENTRRRLLAGDAALRAVDEAEQSRSPIRYLPVTGVISDNQAAAVASLKIPGVWLEQRAVREYVGGDEAASIIGTVGFEQSGMMGVERILDARLQGTPGSIMYVRDAVGNPLWLPEGAVQAPTAGSDERLSIDLELQRMCHQELERGVEEQNAAGGRLVLLDPHSGEVLAMCDVMRDLPDAVPYPWVDAPPPRRRGDPAPRAEKIMLKPGQRYITLRPDPARKIHPALGRNRCIEDIYEPGSTFKPFVWSTITELGLIKPADVIDTEGGRWHTSYGRYIEDVTKRPTMTWQEVLINSSNIGMVKGAERLTWEQLHDVPVRFGFGKRTGVGVPGHPLPGEAAGIVTSMGGWTKFTQTSVAYGHEISVTPVQMVRAFSVFARTGDLAGTLPRLRMTSGPDDSAGLIYRVLPPEIAVLTRNTMTGVVDHLDEKMKDTPEGGWRYKLFGKSGTAEIPLGKAPKGKKAPRGSKGYFDNQFNSSFIAGGPLENPRLVCIVVIDDPGPRPGPRNLRYGTAAAGPVVRRVMERALTYMGVPPSPRDPEPTTSASEGAPAGPVAAATR